MKVCHLCGYEIDESVEAVELNPLATCDLAGDDVLVHEGCCIEQGLSYTDMEERQWSPRNNYNNPINDDDDCDNYYHDEYEGMSDEECESARQDDLMELHRRER